jgi:hypothetical protein
VKDFATFDMIGLSNRIKTDARDALMIAQFLSHGGYLR